MRGVPSNWLLLKTDKVILNLRANQVTHGPVMKVKKQKHLLRKKPDGVAVKEENKRQLVGMQLITAKVGEEQEVALFHKVQVMTMHQALAVVVVRNLLLNLAVRVESQLQYLLEG